MPRSEGSGKEPAPGPGSPAQSAPPRAPQAGSSVRYPPTTTGCATSGKSQGSAPPPGSSPVASLPAAVAVPERTSMRGNATTAIGSSIETPSAAFGDHGRRADAAAVNVPPLSSVVAAPITSSCNRVAAQPVLPPQSNTAASPKKIGRRTVLSITAEPASTATVRSPPLALPSGATELPGLGSNSSNFFHESTAPSSVSAAASTGGGEAPAPAGAISENPVASQKTNKESAIIPNPSTGSPGADPAVPRNTLRGSGSPCPAPTSPLVPAQPRVSSHGRPSSPSRPAALGSLAAQQDGNTWLPNAASSQPDATAAVASATEGNHLYTVTHVVSQGRAKGSDKMAMQRGRGEEGRKRISENDESNLAPCRATPSSATAQPGDVAFSEAVAAVPDEAVGAAAATPFEGNLDLGADAAAAITWPPRYPPVYIPGSTEYFPIDESWLATHSGAWLYSLADSSYYHVETESYFFYDASEQKFVRMFDPPGFVVKSDELIGGNYFTTEPTYSYEEVLDESAVQPSFDGLVQTGANVDDSFQNLPLTAPPNDLFFLDFNRDLEFQTAKLVSGHNRKKPGQKLSREDRHVTVEQLSLEEETGASPFAAGGSRYYCFYSAVFDGHGGSGCAKYCAKYLGPNITEEFRQAKVTLARKLARMTQVEGKAATIKSLGLQESAAVECLKQALKKAFVRTDNNYNAYAESRQVHDGCTVAVVLLYGPDEDGSLKLLTAHVGDSRVVLCRGGTALPLTSDHRPHRRDERLRIEAEGGMVKTLHGIHRVLANDGRHIFGLSTSRTIGDYHMKSPKKYLIAKPEVTVRTIDFDRDRFVVLATDGVWSVVSSQEVCDIASPFPGSPQQAAESVAEEASRRGSTDDITATVVAFKWYS